MRRIVIGLGALLTLPLTAWGADIPIQRPVYKAPSYAPYNWTGLYVGAHFGYGWSTLTGTDTTDGTRSSGKLKGILGGAQLGYNYQIGSVVIGIEGDFSAADVKLTDNGPFGFGALNVTVKNDYFVTIAGRLGYAVDRALWYIKGGGAFTRDKWDVSDGVGGTATGRFDRTGWMVGAGLEYAIWDKWSAKLEYNYLSFGGQDQQLTTTGGLAAAPVTDVTLTTHLLKLGVNYRFF